MSSGCIMHSKPEIAQQSNKGQESIQDKKYSAEAGCDCRGQASGHSLFVQLQSLFAVVAQGTHALLKELKRAVLNGLHFLRAILGSQKNRGIYRDFPHIPSLHTWIGSTISTLLTRMVHSFTKNDITSTHHNHPRSVVYLRFHFWCCTWIWTNI